MTWTDRTPAQRVELRERGRARRERRHRNEATLWQTKTGQVRSDADWAVLEFDRARARIKRLPAARRDAEWRRLAGLLRVFNGDGE